MFQRTPPKTDPQSLWRAHVFENHIAPKMKPLTYHTTSNVSMCIMYKAPTLIPLIWVCVCVHDSNKKQLWVPQSSPGFQEWRYPASEKNKESINGESGWTPMNSPNMMCIYKYNQIYIYIHLYTRDHNIIHTQDNEQESFLLTLWTNSQLKQLSMWLTSRFIYVCWKLKIAEGAKSLLKRKLMLRLYHNLWSFQSHQNT